MIKSPLLACLAGTIVYDLYPVAIHSLDDRFGNCRPRTDGTYATDLFKQRGERSSQCAIDCEGSKVVAYRIPSHSGALTGNNDFFQNFYLRIKIYCLNIHLFECLTQIYILRFVALTLYKNCILGICLPRDNDSSSG